jgi:hypothetical protein
MSVEQVAGCPNMCRRVSRVGLNDKGYYGYMELIALEEVFTIILEQKLLVMYDPHNQVDVVSCPKIFLMEQIRGFNGLLHPEDGGDTFLSNISSNQFLPHDIVVQHYLIV